MSTGTTLVLLGVACIIAAIVGGGFKLAKTEFPTITSVRRQFILALFGISLILGGWAMDKPSEGIREMDDSEGPVPKEEQGAREAAPSAGGETETAPGTGPSEPLGAPGPGRSATVPIRTPEAGSPPVTTITEAPAVVPPLPSRPPPCEPRMIGQPGFSLALLASGGYRLAAPAGQCPAAGIGETLVVEIELCSGRPSNASTLAPDF